MSIIDLPDWLNPQTLSPPRLLRSTATSVGRYSGAGDVADMMSGDTWAMSIGLAPTRLADSGRVEALVNQLAGGVNLLRCHHLGRPLPRGTLRGGPVLAAAAAQGDAVLQIGGARAGVNLLGNGSFEVNTAGTVADGWTGYSNGSTGAVAYGGGVPAYGALSQYVSAAALGASFIDRAGVYRDSAGAFGGQAMTAACSYLATAGVTAFLELTWMDAGYGFLANASNSAVSTGGWLRVVAGGVAPAGAAIARVYLWMQQGVGAFAECRFDGAQLEIGAAATAYAGAPLLRAGDMLGVAGQLFQVAQDVELSDNGAGTVALTNRVRNAIASGTPVVWSKPTALWRLAGSPSMLMQPGVASGVQLDLLEKAY